MVYEADGYSELSDGPLGSGPHGLIGRRHPRDLLEGGHRRAIANGGEKINHRDLNEGRCFARQRCEDALAYARLLRLSIQRFQGREPNIGAWVEGEGAEKLGQGVLVWIVTPQRCDDVL